MSLNDERRQGKKVEDLASHITVGFVGTMSSLFVDEGVPLLRGQNIKPFALDLTNLKYISTTTHQKWKKSALRAGDVVIVRVGYPGTACVIPEGLGDLNAASLVIVRPDEKLLDSKYLCYVLNSPWGKARVQGRLVGAAQQVFNTHTAAELEIPAPPLPVQQRIAAVLSAYDELVENSQRRIRILESMARALYREWFVQFRFPDHENHPRVASAVGEVPRGWEVVVFTSIADVLSGGTPKTGIAEYWNGQIPFFTPRDVPNCFYVHDTDKHVTEIGLAKCASQLYPRDTVFITARGTVGKVALASVPMAMNQSCYALHGSTGISQHFLFLMALQQVDYLKTNTGGATFDTIVVDTFRRMNVVRPTREIISSFSLKVRAIFEQVDTLQRQIDNLRRTRDLLLPRLLSGQIEIDAA